jgi:hypothetical protein
MKITYSQIEAGSCESVEMECGRHIDKLDRLLKRCDPDLVQLHCSLGKTPRRTEYGFSLNLTLPTGSLQATGLGADSRAGGEGRVRRNQEPGEETPGKGAQGLCLETKTGARSPEAGRGHFGGLSQSLKLAEASCRLLVSRAIAKIDFRLKPARCG